MKKTHQEKPADTEADVKATSLDQNQDVPIHEQRNQSNSNQYRRSIYALDVVVQVVIGTARPTIGELLQMRQDSLLPLSSKINDPVDLVVDNRVIARGELIETGLKTDEIGVRLTEIVDVSMDVLS